MPKQVGIEHLIYTARSVFDNEMTQSRDFNYWLADQNIFPNSVAPHTAPILWTNISNYGGGKNKVMSENLIYSMSVLSSFAPCATILYFRGRGLLFILDLYYSHV